MPEGFDERVERYGRVAAETPLRLLLSLECACFKGDNTFNLILVVGHFLSVFSLVNFNRYVG